jgi:hypothetical protein
LKKSSTKYWQAESNNTLKGVGFILWDAKAAQHSNKNNNKNQVKRQDGNVPVMPAPRRLRQEDCIFRASLGYITKSCLKKKKKSNTAY